MELLNNGQTKCVRCQATSSMRLIATISNRNDILYSLEHYLSGPVAHYSTDCIDRDDPRELIRI